MTVPAETLRKRMNAFMEGCARNRVKITHQRMEIYRVLASSDEHPDAEAIHRRVRKRIPTISPDTVYRNLKLLAEHGLVSVVGASRDRLRFDANRGVHHHFVCVKCGMIRDFCSECLGALEAPEEARALGEPLSLHVEVKGLCRDCGNHCSHR